MGTPSSYTDDAINLNFILEKQSIQGLSVHEARLWIDLKEQQLARSIVALRAVRNTLAPIHSLPDEVLAEIFYHLDRTIRQLHPITPRVPLSHVLKVCRRWNAVALSTPRLWSCIAANNLHAMRRMVKLSKATPLSVVMHTSFGGSPIHDVMQVLSPQFERIMNMEIVLNYPYMSELLAYLSQPAPRLEVLRLELTRKRRCHSANHSLIVSPELFSRKAPALLSIDLHQVTIPFTTIFSGLLHLQLRFQHPIHTPSMSKFLDVLEACPGLQTLVLQDAGPLLPDDVNEYVMLQRLVILRHLQDLKLHNRSIDIAHLLAHIHVPPGCIINLTSTLEDTNSDLSAILPQDCSALAPLVGLKWLTFSVEDLSNITISGGSSRLSASDFEITLLVSEGMLKPRLFLSSLLSFFPLANLDGIEFIDCAPHISKQQYVDVLSHLSGAHELCVWENHIARQMQLLEALKSPPTTESKEKSVICPKLKILRFSGLDCIDVVIENVARCCRARTLCGTPLEVLTISGLCDADVEKLSAAVPIVNNDKWYMTA